MSQDESKQRTQGQSGREPKTGAAPGEPESQQPSAGATPAAGPHADPALTNPDATPGTGALPPVGPAADPNMQSTG